MRRTSQRIAVLLIIGLIAAASASAALRAQDAFIFEHVTVIPMDTDNVLRDVSVMVIGDRIVALAAADKIAAPAGANRIDGTGRYLMPGLSDMHTHTWDENEFALFIANGVTTIRNMWGTELHRDWQREIETGERVDAPTIYTTGVIVDGTPPIWPSSIGVDNPDEAERVVREQAEGGFQYVKVYQRLTREVYDRIIRTAREENIAVVGHVPSAVGLHTALESRQTCIEHLSGYLEACSSNDSNSARGGISPTAAVAAFDDSKLDGVVQATVNAGTWNCPTLIVMNRIGHLDDAGSLMDEDAMRYVAPAMLEQWNPANDFRFKEWTADRFEAVREGNRIRSSIVHSLHEADARLLLGTDTPNPFVVPGFSIHQELELMVQAGLTPLDALRTGTTNAAKFVGEPGEFGAVKPGMRADLVLLDADPLDNISNTRSVAGVMVRGHWLPAESLNERIEALAREYSAAGDDGDEPPADDSDPNAQDEPIPPAPETYMGRTIATTMHYTGAPWLVRGSRARQEGTELLLEQLDVKPGSTICDMGCGNGYYTIPLARMTGEEGTVYAVDIQKEMLQMLEAAEADAGLDNIEPVLGTVVDPKLPDGEIDLILVVDVYHEMSHPEQMLAAMRKSLSKNGRLVLVEFRAEDPDVPIKPLHKMSKEQVLKELTANGFRLAEEFDGLPWQHLMTFVIDPEFQPR